jgi:hypothetical protein
MSSIVLGDILKDENRGQGIEQENGNETVGTKPTRPQKLYFEATWGMPRGRDCVPGRSQAVVPQISPQVFADRLEATQVPGDGIRSDHGATLSSS